MTCVLFPPLKLTLTQQGETIDVTRMDVGGGWWEGMIDGVVGLFPEGYVELVSWSPLPHQRVINLRP